MSLNDYYESDSFTFKYPIKTLKWLEHYHITQQDLNRHGVLYDENEHLLHFPVINQQTQQVIHISSRYFGNDSRHPKYISRGSKTTHFKFFNYTETTKVFILTEDFISAFRVGKEQLGGIPLFGTYIPKELVKKLQTKSLPVRIWLDRDKALTAMKQAARIRQWIPDTRTIVTDLDPKCYTDKEINEFVSSSFESNAGERDL